MMKIAEIEKLIQQGESNTLEFKSSLAELKKAMTTVCALLNREGGSVLIGVKNDGRLVGQTISEATHQEIARELNKFEPPAHIQVNYIPFEQGKQVVMLYVEAGPHAPYVYDGRPYYREMGSTHKMPQQRYDQLVAQRAQLNYSWERFPAKGYSIRDLDENLMLGVIRKAVEAERLPEIALRQNISDVLERLELMENGQLNNAAVVLFGKRFNADFIQCQLKVARFKGTNRNEFLDSDLMTNNLFELLEAGTLFIRRHLPLAAKIPPEQLERVEKLLIPFTAVRETLLNSLCHRDYSVQGGSVGLAIYDDRMEVFNDGGLPNGLTLEKVKAGFSKPRNPIIAKVLYRCKVIEQWGRGISKIIESCLEAGNPEPKFQSDPIEFKVVFPFPSSLRPETALAETNTESIISLIHLTTRQHEILSILMANKLGLKTIDIKKKLSDFPAERTLRDDLAFLKKEGFIKSQGRGPHAFWLMLDRK